MSSEHQAHDAAGPEHGLRLHLFSDPFVSVAGRRREIPEGCKRLVAFTALNGGCVDRRRAAGILWPDGDDVRATGNLRSALWRLRSSGADVLDADKRLVRIRPGVEVDTDIVTRWATKLITGPASADDLVDTPWAWCRVGLLPGWPEDWAGSDRERFRQRGMHAMEALAGRLSGQHRPAEALAVANALVAVEPLRESAHRVLVEVLVAGGRRSQAWTTYARFCARAQTELGCPAGASIRAVLPAAG